MKHPNIVIITVALFIIGSASLAALLFANKNSFSVQTPVAISLNPLPPPILSDITPMPSPAPTTTEPVMPTEKQLDVNNWATYKNMEFDFELKYPKDWTIDETKQRELVGSYFSFKRNQVEVFGIGVFKGSVEADILSRIEPRPNVVNLDINGIKAIGVPQGNFELPYQIYFERTGFVFYEAEAPSTQPGDGEYIKAVLSTFK